jgi:L-fuculose-phosphate aldolase
MTIGARDPREAIVEACRRLHARGLIAGTEGNISVRLDEEFMLITPAGADKATLQPDDIMQATLLASPNRHSLVTPVTSTDVKERDSSGRASSEIEMHRTCYALRPDVHAVVHAHPPAATGMATAGKALPPNIVPELPVVVGPVALVPYGRPGTAALSAMLAPVLRTHEVFLLANHGVTTVGNTLDQAMQRMESTEQAARIAVVAEIMGGARTLPKDEVEMLVALHPRFAAHLNRDQT